MNNKLRWVLVLPFLLSFIPHQTAQAVRGVPGSTEFGYGAWLHLNGGNLNQALSMLQTMTLDWVGIELDWADLAPSSDTPVDFDPLTVVVGSIQKETAVMISLTHAPAWAITPAGPDPEAVASFVSLLGKFVGEKLTAVELFPGANTLAGWGANPDPAAYANFFQKVEAQLETAGTPVLLVAAGLIPLSADHSTVDWSDIDYLRGMYNVGAQTWMQVLSVQYPQLTGTPLQPGSDSTITLRRYEAIRQVMLDANHANGALWVTRLCAPDGTINSADQIYADPQHQAEWLQQALIQMRSQLYMGVVFAHNLNPAENNQFNFGHDALALDRGSVHPFYSVFKAIIHQTNPEAGSARPGRPKGSTLLKCKYKT